MNDFEHRLTALLDDVASSVHPRSDVDALFTPTVTPVPNEVHTYRPRWIAVAAAEPRAGRRLGLRDGADHERSVDAGRAGRHARDRTHARTDHHGTDDDVDRPRCRVDGGEALGGQARVGAGSVGAADGANGSADRANSSADRANAATGGDRVHCQVGHRWAGAEPP